MRKLVSCLLVFVLVFSMCACSKTSTSHGETGNLISKNEAEDLACSALYSELLRAFGKTYDISQTRYSIGSITGSPSAGFTVNGKYSLYDKYGNYQKSNNFSAKVDSSGKSTVLEY